MSVISAVQASFYQPLFMVHISTTRPLRHVGLKKIPPPLNATPILPLAVDSTVFLLAFWQLGSMRNPNVSTDDTSTLLNYSGTILMVNSCTNNGYIYDANGNCIS